MNNDIYKREAQFFQRQLSKERYCSFCGKPIVKAWQDENGRAVEGMEWEWMNKAHVKCAEAFYAQKIREQQDETGTH